MKPFTKSQIKRIFSQLGHDPEVVSCNKDYILVRIFGGLTLEKLEKIKKAFNGIEIELEGDRIEPYPYDSQFSWPDFCLDLTIILKE